MPKKGAKSQDELPYLENYLAGLTFSCFAPAAKCLEGGNGNNCASCLPSFERGFFD